MSLTRLTPSSCLLPSFCFLLVMMFVSASFLRLGILRRFFVESCFARRRAEVISGTLVLTLCSRFFLVDLHSAYWVVCSRRAGFRFAQHFKSPFKSWLFCTMKCAHTDWTRAFRKRTRKVIPQEEFQAAESQSGLLNSIHERHNSERRPAG